MSLDGLFSYGFRNTFFLFNGSLLSVKLISVRPSGGITIEFPIIIGLHQG